MNIKQHIAKLKKQGLYEAEIVRKGKEELVNSLLEFEEKYQGKSVVCTEYQLGRDELGFSTEMKKLRRGNAITECAFFVQVNWDSVSNGRLFVIDEAKTEKHINDLKKHKDLQLEKQNLENEVGEDVANAIKAIGKTAKLKTSKN